MSGERLTQVARRLRGKATDAEGTLWHRLRARQIEGAKFRRQVPIDRFVADFVCREAKLVIELDGGQHAERIEADRERTAIIEAHGYTMLRFWNGDVAENVDGVLEEIRSAILNARAV